MVILILYAFRTKGPKAIVVAIDPVGPDNDRVLTWGCPCRDIFGLRPGNAEFRPGKCSPFAPRTDLWAASLSPLNAPEISLYKRTT